MKNLLKALATFNKECPPVKKESDNPFFKSAYASLDSIQHHIKPYLEKNGLLVTQSNVADGVLTFVETKVWHVDSGEHLSSVFPVVVSKQTAQDYGSAVSYAKRYSLSGVLNLIIEDQDDDGEKAMGRQTETKVEKAWLNEGSPEFKKVKDAMSKGYTIEQVRQKYNVSKKVADLLTK